MFKRLLASRHRPCFRNLGSWDKLDFDLSGNRLEITLPPQDYDFPEEDNGKRFNLFDSGFYKYETKPDKCGNPPHFEGISKNPIWRRNWDTYGGFWAGSPLGKLQSSAVICDISRMPNALNCFNPEQMERLVMHGIYYSSGPGFGCTINKKGFQCSNEFLAPINWQIKELHGIEWVYYESRQRRPAWQQNSHFNYDSVFTAWLITPLFTDKYLIVSFSAIGCLPAEPSNRLMHARIAQVIPQIKLSLAPAAQKQRADALAQAPQNRYSINRQPEPWAYYQSFREGDPFKGENHIVFEGPCSPPPTLF